MMAARSFLLVYDWRRSKLDHWRDLALDVKTESLTPEQARHLYAEYEARFPQQDGYEVVLIGADSIETVRKTHSHYFGGEALDTFDEIFNS